jgi:NitT/TauT family transport system substrate-binding protein
MDKVFLLLFLQKKKNPSPDLDNPLWGIGIEGKRTMKMLPKMMAALAMLSTAHAAEPWRYGTVDAKGDAGILFMPEKFGTPHGIQIQMLQFVSSVTPVKALLSGSLDAFTIFPGNAITGMAHGASLKFVGCSWQGATYVLYGARGVHSVAELKDKSIGTSSAGALPDLFAREVLRQNNIPLSDVTMANAGSGAARYKAVLEGVVAGAATDSEFIPQAQKDGIAILATAHQATPLLPRNCIVTTQQVIDTRRDELVRFLAAVMDGTAYALTHRDQTLALTREITHQAADDPGPAYVFDEAVRQHDIDPSLVIPMDKLRWTTEMLVAAHQLQQVQDAAAWVDDAPRQDALKQRTQ